MAAACCQHPYSIGNFPRRIYHHRISVPSTSYLRRIEVLRVLIYPRSIPINVYWFLRISNALFCSFKHKHNDVTNY